MRNVIRDLAEFSSGTLSISHGVLVSMLLILTFGCAPIDVLPQDTTELLRENGARIKHNWRIELNGNILSSPLVHGERVYIQTTEAIHSIDLHTGTQEWAEPLQTDTNPNPDYLVLAPSKNGCIIAFGAADGAVNWTACLTQDDSVRSGNLPDSPLMSVIQKEDLVFATRYNWKLSAYSAHDGKLMWDRPIANRRIVSVIDCKHGICIDESNSLLGLDLSGQVVGKLSLEPEIGPITSTDGIVYTVYGDNRTSMAGTENLAFGTSWETNVSEWFSSGVRYLTAHQNHGLIATGEGIAVLDRFSGEVIWGRSTTHPLGPVTIYDGNIVAKDSNERLVFFDIESGVISNLVFPDPEPNIRRESWPSPAGYKQSLIVPFKDGSVISIDQPLVDQSYIDFRRLNGESQGS